MKTKLLILFCSLAWSIGFAQNHHKIDSLKQELAAAESDSARYATLYMLYREFVEIVNDSALYYLEQQISIAERNDKKLALAKALGNKGYVLMGLERYSESLQALKEGFEIAENPKNESSAWFPATQGTQHEIRMWTLGHLHLDYGHLMRAGNMTDQQLFHYMEAEKFAKQAGDYELLGFVNANLASRYLWALNELDSALLMYQKALTYFAQAGQKKWLAGVFADLAEIYKRKKEARLAVGYFHKAVQASQSINDFNSLYWNYYSLTDFYINDQNRDSSLYYAQRMVELAHLHPEHFKQDVGASYLLLSESYELNNQIDSAFKYLRLESPFRDSSYRVSTRNLSNVQKLSFEEQLRAEQLEKEKAALQNRIRQIILLCGLGLVLLVAFFLYRNNRQRQKANALLRVQNRELEIEAALERVRGQAMSMGSSDELSGLVGTVFSELTQLDFRLDHCIIWIFDAETLSARVWTAGVDIDKSPESYFIKQLDHPYYHSIIEGWKAKNPKWVYALSGEEKKSMDDLLLNETELSRLPVAMKTGIREADHVHVAISFNNFGGLEASGLEPLSEENLEILSRFGKVFDLTYTRVLDLQKAEADARKAQIEAALERVRSSTMAMHKTDELRSVIATVFEQVQTLGFDATACGLTLFNKEDKSMVLWLAGFETDSYPASYHVPYFDHPLYNAQFEAWEKGQTYQLFKFEGELKRSYDKLIFELGDFKHLPSSASEAILSIETATNCTAFMKYGMLESVMTGDEVLSEQQADTLQRFAKVFEQTYTRFLDLQKAEAQAREAQIEAALERVRASMMAMHRSDELRQVIGTMFSQLQSLDFDAPGSALIIYNKDGAAEHWMTGFSHDSYPQSYKIPYNEHPYFLDLYQAWQDNLPYEEFPFEGPAKLEYTEWALEHSEFKNLPDEFKQEMRNPARIIMADAFNKYGMVEIMTLEPLNPSEISILKRFSKVFEQTYTRFLDLQRAEAQAREAQIEAALERVRSRAIAMRHSDELSEAAELLYNEFLKMGVESFSCGYLINDDENQEWKIWLTNPGEPFFKEFWTCPYFADHNLKARYESWKRKDEFHCAVLEGEENRAHHVVISKYAPWKEAMLDTLPPRLVFNSAHFSLGHLLVISPDRLAPELEQAMVRFAKVFDLTYRRFLDLQKAEARAREERIEAGLDRVRAEIASMRSTEDLERITPLVWRELTTFGVPFFRCGVFIMDEANELVHAYLSTPDGNSLAALHLPFKGADTTQKTVEHWRKREVYTDFWDKQQFAAWAHSMAEQGYVREEKTYQGGEEPPESLSLHFVPFTQGMLYVGSAKALAEDQIGLVKTLADAFAVAYARYEDFTKLEEAKNRVEATLAELKSTQSQLIQSEKLASLGELTAGIAHEIQNPLNFVNNFSELSVDLAKEINEEMDKEPVDTGFVKELMGDLTQNQQKINHHGKRAAAIVSGMLQHARTSTGTKEPTDLNALADEYMRLSYHGLRAKDPNFNAKMVTDFDPDIGKVNVIPQDMGRVLLNLINNAFYAVQQHERQGAARALPGFQNLEGLYVPTVTLSTKKLENTIEIRVKDNGTGIPDSVKAKIFQPFFTTKPTGQGTGLGLSLAYDIVVKGHGGTLEVETKEGEGTEFVIQLPTKNS